MDAGVPISAAAAGISIGMVSDDHRSQLLTDIQGVEDFSGDMDFKVAGTRQGVTAIQMDVKGKGLTADLLAQAFAQSRQARQQILDRMDQTIARPRAELAPHAPRVYTVEVDPDKIGDVIGPGGKTIKKMEAEFDVKIDIEQDGRIFVAATDQASGQKAVKMIEDITRELQVGEIYLGKVVRIVPFGAFIELMPGRDGLLHISQISRERIERVEDALQLGDEIEVRVIEIDPQGKVRLSRKEAVRPIEPMGSRGDRDGSRRGPRRGGFRR
jgi:polyribonucleotide nucleotidyltransferase